MSIKALSVACVRLSEKWESLSLDHSALFVVLATSVACCHQPVAKREFVDGLYSL
jgi:hypothetical protein